MAVNAISFRDLSIAFKKHPVTDDVVVSKDVAAIKQAIVNLLLTNKGEKLFNPDYGSGIREYLFEPLDYATAGQVTLNIKNTINTFEPRVAILSLSTTPNFDDNGFDVELTFDIRGTDLPPVAVEFFLVRTR